jgi:hypothetical protein
LIKSYFCDKKDKKKPKKQNLHAPQSQKYSKSAGANQDIRKSLLEGEIEVSPRVDSKSVSASSKNAPVAGEK